jgi:hypothetical protein
MTAFGRSLDERALEALEDAAAPGQAGHWWRDLLRLWRPSGTDSGGDGLRLAVRNGYVDFYRGGRSLARVSVVRGAGPVLAARARWVLSAQDRAFLQGAEFATLTGPNALLRRNAKTALAYDGVETLKAWIEAADDDPGDPPRRLLDELLGLPANDGVIDLDTGLPARAGQAAAPAVDLAAIGRRRGELTVFLAEVGTREFPEIPGQTADYGDVLAAPGQRALVGRQYADCARLLVRLRAMADRVGPARRLGRTILDAAWCERLEVAEPAIRIVLDRPAALDFGD